MQPVTIVAALISIAVPAFAIYLISVLDLFGTGKGYIIGVCLGWGAVGAFGLALMANTFTQRNLGLSFELVARGSAPILEELFKALILLWFIEQPRFRYFVDGAIYGFAAGIGFSVSENLYYVSNDASEAALSIAISRVLSASLMHAAASSVFGISLGLSRRSQGIRQIALPIGGLIFAILVHAIYNNLLFLVSGSLALLFVGIGIGLGGGLLIALFINLGLSAEKLRFEESLGIQSGVSTAERKAVQQLGSDAIEEILDEMAVMFGEEKAQLIQRMLTIQANIGILNNNLRSPVSKRLRTAWEKEVADLRSQMDAIRHDLGTYIMTLLRSLLPEDDTAVWTDFSGKVAAYDPNHVHSFDLFLVASELSGTISAEELEKISNRLSRISIFQSVDLADLENLSRAVKVQEFSHGQIIFSKGDTGDAMYLIDRGYIDIFTTDITGKETLLVTYGPGDVVGELALLDGQPRSATARANGPLRVMVLQRQHFSMFIQSRPKVILSVLQFLAQRVRHTTRTITGETDQMPVTHALDVAEDTTPLAPQATDTIEGGKAPMGVFGRLSETLDQLEREAEQNKLNPKK